MQVNLASAPDSREPFCDSGAVGYDARALYGAYARVCSASPSPGGNASTWPQKPVRAYDFGHRVSHNVVVNYVVNVRGPLEALDRPSVSLRMCVLIELTENFVIF
jgi:hypothetical protein